MVFLRQIPAPRPFVNVKLPLTNDFSRYFFLHFQRAHFDIEGEKLRPEQLFHYSCQVKIKSGLAIRGTTEVISCPGQEA